MSSCSDCNSNDVEAVVRGTVDESFRGNALCRFYKRIRGNPDTEEEGGSST